MPVNRSLLLGAALAAPVAVLLGVVGVETWRAAAPPVDAAPITTIGGPFALKASTGGVLTSDSLRGRPFLVFFGFTRCPEVCPTTVAELDGLFADLAREGRPVPPALFITVDPERDTAESLRAYLGSFGDRVVGLTGTPEEIAAVAKSYKTYFAKVPQAGGDYTMDHTTSTYLMDGQGRFVGTIAYGEDRGAALAKLRRLVQG